MQLRFLGVQATLGNKRGAHLGRVQQQHCMSHMQEGGQAPRLAQPLSAPAWETLPAAPAAEAACDPLPTGTPKGEGSQPHRGSEFPGHWCHAQRGKRSEQAWRQSKVAGVQVWVLRSIPPSPLAGWEAELLPYLRSPPLPTGIAIHVLEGCFAVLHFSQKTGTG